MNLTRRQACVFAGAAMAAPGAARAEPPPTPIFFVEPGAKAPSRAAYEAAIARGADFLTAPVAATADGGLIVAPNNELSVFTDVASRPDFASRRRDQNEDGVTVGGWFSEDFTLPELRSLLTGPAKAGGRALAAPTLLSLQEVIDVARAGSIGAARVIGVSPRLIRPAYFVAQGLDLEKRLADLIRLNGYDSPAAAMIVQSGEPAALKAVAAVSRVRRVQLVDAEGGPADLSVMRYRAMVNADGLRLVSAWAGAIAAPESLMLQPGPKDTMAATGLVQAAHAAGLAAYARAVPTESSDQGARQRLVALFASGVDGVMCADVGLAVKARGEAMDRLRPHRDE
jgi:glycerophosphoryl diester phosphodiesterase